MSELSTHVMEIVEDAHVMFNTLYPELTVSIGTDLTRKAHAKRIYFKHRVTVSLSCIVLTEVCNSNLKVAVDKVLVELEAFDSLKEEEVDDIF